MIENARSRTALICVDIADGRLWVANGNHTLPDCRLVPLDSAADLDAPIDCAIYTPAAKADKAYGFVVQNYIAPRLVAAGRKR